MVAVLNQEFTEQQEKLVQEFKRRLKMTEIAYHTELNTCALCGRPPSLAGEMTGWGCESCVEAAEITARGEVPYPDPYRWEPDDADEYYTPEPIDEHE